MTNGTTGTYNFTDVVLEGLSEKIFLDRYAAKELDKSKWVNGARVVAMLKEDPLQPLFRKTVVGKIETLGRDSKTALVKDDSGELHGVPFDSIEYPKELLPKEMWERIARALSGVEAPEQREQVYQDFAYALDNWKIVPGGRVAAGAGTEELTLMNCFVIPSPHDSRQGIMETLLEMTEIMSRGGGVGINLSTLRPKRETVHGVNGHSSGSVSWGGLFSYTTGLIEQGGSRRGALMLMINDWHPDTMAFITAKSQMGLITNANMSVCVSNTFMEVLKNDGDWTFEFPVTKHEAYDTEWTGDLAEWKAQGYPVNQYGTVKASEVWDAIISSAWKSAEPGVVFMERYNKESNSWYYNPVICTNPCGEQGLPAYGVCNLSAINLSKFYDEAAHDVNWAELRKIVHIGVRMCDNVTEYTMYPLKGQKQNQQNERRSGLGTMGLAELMIKLKIRYGSPESLLFLDKIYAFMAVEAYKASIDLAEEKGRFAMCEPALMAESGFMKRMLPKLEKEMVAGSGAYEESYDDKFARVGIRNVTVITQAPTGSTGTMVGTSTGIEPYFAFEYTRGGRLGTEKQYVPIAQEWLAEHPGEELPKWFTTSMELSPEDHVRVQAAIQMWTDSSISKTANAPHDFTVEDTKKLYELAYELGCKGVTIYRDGSRDIQVLNTIKDTDKDAPMGLEKAEVTHDENDFVSGKTCEIREENGQRIIDCGTH